MGAGHDGAAFELQRRLEAAGHEVVVVDYLKMIPFRLGGFVKWTYLFQLQRLPWTYDLTYQAFNKGIGAILWGPVVRGMSLATRRPLRRKLEANTTRRDRVDLSRWRRSSLAACARRSGCASPVATFLTDFAVHPLWVHPGVDLHLAVSPLSAETAAKRGGRTSRASGPLVGDRFRAQLPDRDAMRRILGIEPEERAVLVVAGSWGVGDVASTVRAIARCGSEYHPITVCGQDEKLRSDLLEEGLGGTVLGWTDDMPGLMAAADALVENAGGLSAMEAFAAEVPVISFQPIAGHGKDNAKYMDVSGVSRYAHDEAELADALHDATTPGAVRDEMIAAGRGALCRRPGRRRRRARGHDEGARAAHAVPDAEGSPARRRPRRIAARPLLHAHRGCAWRRCDRRRRGEAAEGRDEHGVPRDSNGSSRAARERRCSTRSKTSG